MARRGRDETPAGEAGPLTRGWHVWGRYREAVVGGRLLALRSRLELFRPPLDPGEAIEGCPDLLAVMMNPGGSRPLRAPDRRGWAPAMADRTQHQLMRLADRVAQAGGRPWRHLRVLNLSDIRTPKSAELFRLIADLGDSRHSLFAAARRRELLRALGSPSTPVLLAWGLGPSLRPWAALALEAVRGRPMLGLTDDGVGFRHPLPQRADLQRAWLEAVVAQILGESAAACAGRPGD